MDILQCKLCKKPFQSLGGKICPACLEQMEVDFVKVRDYIREHDKTDMDEVSENTGVSMNTIMHFLKEGRLEIGDSGGGMSGGGVLFCEVCKKPINTGRMCSDCKKKVATRIESSINPGAGMQAEKKSKPIYSEKSAAKMHLDHKEK